MWGMNEWQHFFCVITVRVEKENRFNSQRGITLFGEDRKCERGLKKKKKNKRGVAELLCRR